MNSPFARLLLDEPLAGIGLVPAPANERGTGVRYEGDGRRSEGWFYAWSLGCGAVVAACDFTMLKSSPFSISFRNYFAVRHETAGLLPPSEVKAFLETNPRQGAVVLPKGCRCAYVEVEYYDEYCLRTLGSTVPEALGRTAALLQTMNDRCTWSASVVRVLRSIEDTTARGIAADLLYRGAVDELMSGVLHMQHDREGSVSPLDRQAIARVVTHIREHADRSIRQEELLTLASMGATKFKHLFKAMTGMTATEYVTEVRMDRARNLLLDAGLGVEEVARRCGYEAPTSFATVFRKRTGLSPRAWRQRARVSFSDDPQAVVQARAGHGAAGQERSGTAGSGVPAAR